MKRYKLSRLALSDLKEIRHYTLKQWGQAQADIYLNRLHDCLEHVASQPNLGHFRGGLKPRVYGVSCGSHVIFYRIATDGIEVARILHKRMEPTRHLH